MTTNIRHILVCSDQYPIKEDPVFPFVEQLVNAFSKMGIHISVVAPQSLTKVILRGKPLHPRYRKIQKKDNGLIEVYQPYVLSFGNKFPKLNRFFAKASLCFALSKIKSKPQICYGHFWHCAIALYSYAKRNNIPLFVSSGEADVALETNVAKEKIRSFLNYYSGVFFVSSKNKKECEKLGYLSSQKNIVVPNSIDPLLFYKKDRIALRKKYSIPLDSFIVVFVGGFIERKGPDRVADALRKIGNNNIKAFFIGHELDDVKCDINYDGILLKSVIEHDCLATYLNMADVFVLPTLAEGCCNAIVEAMACGLPIISSNLPFNDDILDDSCSIRVNPRSVEEIVSAILTLHDNIDLRKKMEQASLKKAVNLSIDKRAEKILNFIETSVSCGEELVKD